MLFPWDRIDFNSEEESRRWSRLRWFKTICTWSIFGMPMLICYTILLFIEVPLGKTLTDSNLGFMIFFVLTVIWHWYWMYKYPRVDFIRMQILEFLLLLYMVVIFLWVVI